MTDDAKPATPPLADALRSDPKDNARNAGRIMGGDRAKRRETEEAQEIRRKAERDVRRSEPGAVPGGARLPPD